MGLEVATIATIVGAGVSAVGFIQGQEARKDAKRAQEEGLALQRQAQGEQEKIQGEQRAQNAAQAAAERRNQIRAERVRRARVLQSSENTGVGGSSGEFGALGTLGTGLGVNLGANAGKVAAGARVSDYAQTAANFMGQAQDKGVQAQNFAQDAAQADRLFGFGNTIFSASGGFSNFKTPKFGTGGTDFSGVDYQATRDN